MERGSSLGGQRRRQRPAKLKSTETSRAEDYRSIGASGSDLHSDPGEKAHRHNLHQSAKAEEAQNREHDDDSADKPDQIVHGEPFSCFELSQP
ncbi:hypothetical protein FHX14_001786 [Rhizobium sp. BK619]|uniref:hypothetical protein n=1 Tax=Rhizobium sp. BK619 TaxID=2586989 RepID=UPI001621081C|nr:hypothetical protein [Rhizobium sp. BK619]MBB3645607.1 hypothetical protein [Rhizobium sp. BK619]